MISVSNKVFYVGTNDRKKSLFENNWPLPNGIAYNSYVIADEHPALIDTLEYGSNLDYIDEINEALEGRNLEYLIVNHMEPDHSSMIGEILRRYPAIKIVANSVTFKILESYYPLSENNKFQINDRERLDLGYHKLLFVFTPWVHWPETMMTYDQTDQMLFSCDAFGSFGALNGGIFDDMANFDFYKDEMLRYYTNVVGKWSGMVQKALAKLKDIPIKFICPSHGLIWRKDPAKVIALYDKWSRHIAEEGVVIAFASMYGNTEKFADEIARKIAEYGIKNIKIFDVSKTSVSFILLEIWKYKGLVLGSCAFNTDMHPMMSLLTHEIAMEAPKNKVLGLFGGSSWNGAGVRALKTFAENANMPITAGPIEFKGHPFKSDMEAIDDFAKTLADEIKKR